jgi:hypothetical protein
VSVSGGSGQEAVAKVATEQGWWLVDADGRAAGGPFEAQVDAAIAELSWHGGSPAGADLTYGLRMDDGTVVRRFSPEDQGWLAHLSDQLNRLADEWDTHISDADPLTGLVCELAAAVVEAGLPLHDCAGRTGSGALGGVCLTPSPSREGVIVTWSQHDRMAVHHVRGLEAEGCAQQTMSLAVADVLAAFGFIVETVEGTLAYLVRTGELDPTLWD